MAITLPRTEEPPVKGSSPRPGRSLGGPGRRFRPVPERAKVALATIGAIAAAALAAWWSSGSSVVLTQALVTGFLTGGIYSLVAMGLTLIYGVLHIINFANGALVALGLYLTLQCVGYLGIHPYVALALVMPAMFLFGAVVQAVLLNPVMRAPIQIQLLVTIGLALAIENGLLLVFGPNPKAVALPGNRGIQVLGATIELSRVYAFVGALALVGVFALLLQRTRMGTEIRAVAANPEGARLVGINTKGIYVVTFALGATAAGAAAVLVSPFTTIEPTAGAMFNLTAFVVVVLGGMGNVPGALVGGLVVGLTEQLAGLIMPSQSPLLAVFVVFIVVLFLRPRGVFGSSA